MGSNQAKSGYPKLEISQLTEAIELSGWLKPFIFEQVTSTNEIAVEKLSFVGPGLGIAVVADEQSHGRGRLDRNWVAPAGSGIALSIGIDTADFAFELSAVPLVSGLAVTRALRALGIESYLKWPNDIVFENNVHLSDQLAESKLRKAGGILVQLVQDKLIIGIGINVDLKVEDLPVSHATSLSIEGFTVNRIELISKVLEEINFFRNKDISWVEDYSKICLTLNKNISVTKFSGETITGQAIEVLSTGALMIKNLENLYQITVGDIVHLALDQS